MRDQGENSWIDWKAFLDNLRIQDRRPDPFYFQMGGVEYKISGGMTYVQGWEFGKWYLCSLLP